MQYGGVETLVSVSPELRQAYVKAGVHPCRVDSYLKALFESMTFGAPRPALKDFSAPPPPPVLVKS
jgi:hypothetical protein